MSVVMSEKRDVQAYCEICFKLKFFFYPNTSVCSRCILMHKDKIPKYIPKDQTVKYLTELKGKHLI